MANKRQLKKHVQAVCGDLACQLLIAQQLFGGFDEKQVNNIVAEIALLQESVMSNCTFAFDKTEREFESRHAYNVARRDYNRKAYKKLAQEFNDGVLDIVKKMNAALPQDLKETFKEVAN